MKRVKSSILLVFLLPLVSFGQDTLSYNQFMEWVRNYHPVATQADIYLRFGDQEMRIARGGFDPLLFGYYDQKRFNNTQYFEKREAGILIPTVGGVEFNGTFEQNAGTYLNPEQTVPAPGLFSAGASLNVGQGLFIDQRRAALRQAEIYQDITEAERQQLLNDLYVEATAAYWNWSATFQNKLVLEEGVRLAQIRFDGIRESFILGDLPAIDTVEAFSQILNRQYRLQTTEISYFNAVQELNTFLWGDDNETINLLPGTLPQQTVEEFGLEVDPISLRSLIPNHPELRLVDFELASLNIDRRWRAEQLKPVLRVNYNFLSSPTGQFERSSFFENDYKLGLTFRSPIFLRRERGGLGLVKAQMNFKQNDRDIILARLQARLESEINNFETIQRQFGVFYANVEALERLLQGELRMFEIGESSLFLINAREVSVFDARLIINDLRARMKIAFARMNNAAGLGFDDLME